MKFNFSGYIWMNSSGGVKSEKIDDIFQQILS